ncbi:MAG: flagellar filament capping protein FliD [Nitrospiraceae bacterium]|nr:flagellar filament capping protein FliD [Nitrospiraceae bacterium]
MADWTGLVTSGTGYYSGLNISQIVNTLVQADSAPLLNLEAEIGIDNTKISTYGSLLGSLSSLDTVAQNMALPSIYSMTAASSDGSVLTATAGASPAPTAATYSITVSQLAQAQSIYSAGFSSSTSTAVAVTGDVGFEVEVGSGASLTTATITYDSTNNDFVYNSLTYANSLQGVQDAINAAFASNTSGATASILDNGSTSQLVISSDQTGTANRMAILVDTGSGYGAASTTSGISQLAFDPATYSSTDGAVATWNGTVNMQQSMAGLDADLTLNGLGVTRSTNDISDLISGLTINLFATSTSAVNLTVGQDNAGFTSQINTFISTYNSALSAISGAMGTQKSQGPLYQDSLAENLNNTLNDITTKTYNGTSLAALGMTHDSNGNLTLDTGTWNAALAADPSQVLGAINDMASSLQSTLNDYMNTLIPDAEGGLNNEITLYTNQENQVQNELNTTQQMLTQEFQSMEQYLGSLQNENSYFNNLNSSSSGSSSGGSGTGSSGGTKA